MGEVFLKYYDLASIEVPDWYGLQAIKPVIITARNQSELRKQSKQKGLIVLKHPSQSVFRYALDKSLIDAVLPDRLSGHDFLHHKRTLLNNVTLKLMNNYNISLLFSFKELKKVNGLKRSLIWGRMKYEMSLCLKKKVPVILSSMAEEKSELVGLHSLLAMGQLLGLSPKKSKKALSHAQSRILSRTD